MMGSAKVPHVMRDEEALVLGSWIMSLVASGIYGFACLLESLRAFIWEELGTLNGLWALGAFSGF